MAKFSYFKSILKAILIAVGGWALFTLVRLIAQNLLIKIGIVSEIAQVSIILTVVVITLALLGFTFKKTIKNIVK